MKINVTLQKKSNCAIHCLIEVIVEKKDEATERSNKITYKLCELGH